MSKIPVYVGAKTLPPELSASAASVSPRPGGFAKNPENSQVRPARSKNLSESLKEKQFTFKKSEAKIGECDEMLAITISCVMMMASNADNIPDEYFIWADHYLSKIKDENGKLPPNIKGILNHMALMRSDIPNPVVTCRCDVNQDEPTKENQKEVEEAE